MSQCTQSSKMDVTLTRKAVKLALNDLKEKNDGALLSERASKVCNYAPDLAKTLAGLILSSNDLNFQEECISLLGLQGAESDRNAVETCIKDRIVYVITANDRNPWGSREAPSLFVGEEQEEPYCEEVGEDEEVLEYMDM